MQFSNLNEFLAMGGYGFYVWLSFGLTLIVIALLTMDSSLAKNKLFKSALQQEQRKQRIAQAQQANSREAL